MFANLQPELDGSNGEHGKIVVSILLVTGSDAPRLLEPVDETLHTISCSVDSTIKWTAPSLVSLMGNRVVDMPTAQVSTNLATTLAFVSHYPARAQPWLPTPKSFDRTLLHQMFKHHCLMSLARSYDKRHWLASAFGTQVDLGGEATLTASYRFSLSRTLVSTCGMLMRSYHRAIDVVGVPIDLCCRIGLLLECFQMRCQMPLLHQR